MIFDVTSVAGGGSGGIPEYVWVEYNMKKELRYTGISSYAPAFPGEMQRSGGYVVSLPRRASWPFYASLSADPVTGDITWTGIEYIDSPRDWIPVNKYFWCYSLGYVNVTEFCNTTNFSTGVESTSFSINTIYRANATSQEVPGTIKAIHLTEHSGPQFQKVPIVSLMGGGGN